MKIEKVFFIKCRRCGSKKQTQRTEDVYETTNHLESNWCDKCEHGGDDYWECFNCDKYGNEIDK